MKFFLPIVLFSLASLCIAEKTSYTGYKLIRISLNGKDLIEKLHSFEYYDPEYDVWGVQKFDNEYVVTVMLSPKVFNKYMSLFKSLKVYSEIVVENVQELFDNQERSMKQSKATSTIINKYVRYNEIRNFVLDTAAANPSIASTYDLSPKTVEGRTMTVIKFKTAATASSKRAIWIDCGIHAREWVTPATCVYVIDQIVTEYNAGNTGMVNLLNKYEIHILPVYNPDGYEYSHTSTRLWRKNRKNNGLLQCSGVDLNRNADYKWNTGGASSFGCSDVFAGASAGSEPETQAVVAALQANTGNWDAYYSVHSYGNWWLLPYGHDPNAVAPNYSELEANGNAGAAAIKAVNGEIFTVGSSSKLLYVTTGSTADWAYESMDIKISATLELRPRNGTSDFSYGFELPEDRLPAVTSETWAGIKAAMLDVSARRP